MIREKARIRNTFAPPHLRANLFVSSLMQCRLRPHCRSSLQWQLMANFGRTISDYRFP